LADHSERRARRVVATGKRSINASGEIGSARCAAGFAAAADGPGEALAPGGAADGNAAHVVGAKRADVAFGADVADDRFWPIIRTAGAGETRRAVTPDRPRAA